MFEIIGDEVLPNMQRAVEFVLERSWIEYMLFLLTFMIPLDKLAGWQAQTAYIVAVTAALLLVRHVLRLVEPWCGSGPIAPLHIPQMVKMKNKSRANK